MAGEVASKLLLQSPPLEANAVAASLRAVLGDAPVDAVAAAAFRQHNTAQFFAADLPDGSGKARACEGGREARACVQHAASNMQP